MYSIRNVSGLEIVAIPERDFFENRFIQFYESSSGLKV